MKIMSLYLVLALLISACTNCRNTNRTEEVAKESNEQKEVMNEEQADFLVEAASSGMMEVELSKAAVEKAMYPRVKSFAKMMVEHHKETNRELKNLANKKNITLPLSLDSVQLKDIRGLKQKSGRDFDRSFMERMEDDHEREIRKFEDASENHKDSDVQVFAAKTLTKLRAHLDSVKMIKTLLK